MATKKMMGKFHVKGIWMNSESEDRYMDTIIGSSNFNFRSRYLDTEINAYVSSTDSDFKDHLVREYNSIKAKSNNEFAHKVMTNQSLGAKDRVTMTASAMSYIGKYLT
jgi:phosphatidylserine/phosphatidylglycerophosphate/cardiolipin synthase-like enzyme